MFFGDLILPAGHMLSTLVPLIPTTQSCESKFCWNKGLLESRTYRTDVSPFKSKNVAQIYMYIFKLKKSFLKALMAHHLVEM